jgi:hypothetical protein
MNFKTYIPGLSTIGVSVIVMLMAYSLTGLGVALTGHHLVYLIPLGGFLAGITQLRRARRANAALTSLKGGHYTQAEIDRATRAIQATAHDGLIRDRPGDDYDSWLGARS